MLFRSPRLLLLDEPTAGVDPIARREFWAEIHELAAGGLSVLVSTHYMDEAERCHRVAYLAYGRLLVTGTVEEVIHGRQLITYGVSGPGLDEVSRRLRDGAEIQVTPFGNTLHVTGKDDAALLRVLAPLQADGRYRIGRVDSTLEDVFISLMGDARDNFQ
mgnify:CR=1 FL=1